VAARLTPIACVLLGGCLYWAALGSEVPKAYFFPQMLALTMVVLGAGLLVTDFRSSGKAQAVRIAIPWATIWPGMLALALYMALAQQLGFYLSSWFVFVSIAILYATPARRTATIKRSVPVSIAFLAVLYLVFWMLLRVQLPHGLAF
jgi:Tripartite tricarboxylate transporter TctB family